MDDYDKEVGMKVSDYNSAFLINKRLHDLWEKINNFRLKGQFSQLNGVLDSIWCELASDVPEGDKIDKDFEKINQKLTKISPIINWGNSSGFNKVKEDQSIKKVKQYKTLMEKELFLRRLQSKQGKGTKYVEEDDDWE